MSEHYRPTESPRPVWPRLVLIFAGIILLAAASVAAFGEEWHSDQDHEPSHEVQPVPEPEQLLVLIPGAAAAVVAYRRRRK